MARAATVLAPAALASGAAAAYTRFAAVERSINRIGVTAGATAEQTRAAFGVIDKAAFDYAISQDQVVAGLDSMVASGRSMESALSFLPSVAATAQASGSEITDIATTADALGNSLGINGDKMQGAFDILVKAGKEGKFELKDMAAYIPTLGPAFEALGYRGEYGVKKLAAALQIVRQRTGSSEEAATSFANVLQKMETEETAKKFSKFGINLRKEMAKARSEGKDLLDVFIDLSTKALDGDMSKLPQLFGDAQVIAGMRALIAGGDDLGAMFGRLGDAAGETKKDLQQVVGDSQAKIDRMATSYDKLLKTIGGGVATAANPLLDALNGQMEEVTTLQTGVDKARGPGESLRDVQRAYFDAYKAVHPETTALDAWDPSSNVRVAGRQAFARLGRVETKTIFDDLNREMESRKDTPEVVAHRARATADRSTQWRDLLREGNLDGLDVTRGIPVPHSRDAPVTPSISEREQRRLYDMGRRAGERVMRDAPSPRTLDINQDPGSLMPSTDYVAWKQRKQAATAPVTATDLIAPRAPMTSPREAESASMSAMVLQFAALLDRAGSFAKGTTGQDVKDEAGVTVDTAAMDAAKAKAAETGAAMQTSLAITGRPVVDVSGITAARREAEALAATLRSIPGLSAQASQSAPSAASQGVLNADVER